VKTNVFMLFGFVFQFQTLECAELMRFTDSCLPFYIVLLCVAVLHVIELLPFYM